MTLPRRLTSYMNMTRGLPDIPDTINVVGAAYKAQAFVDGGYLRDLAKALGKPLPSAHSLCFSALHFGRAAQWLQPRGVELTRVNVYDASPDEEASEELRAYWKALEHEVDTRMGWGYLRRSKKDGRHQKGVDVLLAIEMIVGAVDHAYEVGLLVAVDGDFVPLLEEIRRRGMRVALAASKDPGAPPLSSDLRRHCDLFIPIHESYLRPPSPPIEARLRPPDPIAVGATLYAKEGAVFGRVSERVPGHVFADGTTGEGVRVVLSSGASEWVTVEQARAMAAPAKK